MFEKRYTGFNDQVGFFELMHASVTKCSSLLTSRFLSQRCAICPNTPGLRAISPSTRLPITNFCPDNPHFPMQKYPEVSQDGSWLKGRCWEYLTVDVNVMRGHGWSELGSSPNKKTKGTFFVYEKICLVRGMIPTSSWCVCIPLTVWVGVFPCKVICTNRQGKIWWVVVFP